MDSKQIAILKTLLENNSIIDDLFYLEAKHFGKYSTYYEIIKEKYANNGSVSEFELILDGYSLPESESLLKSRCEDYAKEIFDAYQLDVIKKSLSCVPYNKLDETLDTLAKIVNNVNSSYMLASDKKPIDVREFVQSLQDIRKSQKTNGIMVESLPTFNIITGGMLPTDLIGIYGKEKSSKTTLSNKIVLDVAIDQKIPTAVFNFEMDAMQLMMKNFSMITGIDQNVLRNPHQNKYDDHEFDIRARSFEEEFKDSKLFIFDEMLNETQIYSHTNNLIKKHGVKLIVVDYLMLMEASRNFKIRREELNYLSRFFKRMAKQLNIIIILISQANDSGDREAEAKGLSRDANYYFYVQKLEDGTPLKFGQSIYRANEGDYLVTNRGIRHGAGNKSFVTRFIDNNYAEIDVRRM